MRQRAFRRFGEMPDNDYLYVSLSSKAMNKVGIFLFVFLGMLSAGSALATERVRISCDRSLYAAGETI